jgi:hypothetical protein
MRKDVKILEVKGVEVMPGTAVPRKEVKMLRVSVEV